VVGRRHVAALIGKPLLQLREIVSAVRDVGHGLRRDARQRQFFERPRQGPRKTGRHRDRREIAQGPSLISLINRAGRHRLGGQRRRRCQVSGGQTWRRQARGELRQAESVQSEGRTARGGQRADEVVGGASGRAEDEQLGCRRAVGDELMGSGEPCRR
jgi:hypothetical protein